MRVTDWETKLANYIESVKAKPLRYGTFDCAIFAAKCIEAITGTNPISDLLGKYKSKKESLALIKSLCPSGEYSELIKIRCANSKYKEVTRAYAAHGDLVEYMTPEGVGLGICLGSDFIAVGPKHLLFYSMQLALKIYKVD